MGDVTHITPYITLSDMKAVMAWSPTGVVVYKTEAGWMVRKDSAVVVTENERTPRVWKRLDSVVEQLRRLGAKEVRIELA